MHNISVDGESTGLYVDGFLSNQLLKIKKGVNTKDRDWVLIVDGSEGSGKSVLAMQIGAVLDDNFCLSKITFTASQFRKAVVGAKKGECIIFDEAFRGLSSRSSLSEVNRMMVTLMMEMRQKNLFVIIVMPTFFMLDKYAALFRAKGLFHVYTNKGKRGFWTFFNKSKKKVLYILGKKLYNYSNPKSTFKGRFLEKYTVNEELYRKAKKDSLGKLDKKVEVKDVFQHQRDVLIYLCIKNLGLSRTGLSVLCQNFGVSLDRSTIGKIVKGFGGKKDV